MPETFFQITNTLALVAWIALVLAPGRREISGLLCAVVVPAILAAAYVAVIGWKFATDGPPPGDVMTLAGLKRVFADDWVFAAAWAHYLVFDMVVGAWIARDAVRLGLPWPLRTLALVLTFLSGPVGFLVHVLGRVALRRTVAVTACCVILVLGAGRPGRCRAEPPRPSGSIAGHPALAASPRHTTTARGRQGDAVNVALIGSEAELHQALAAAGWYAADPITLETSLRIAADCVLHKPYAHAPVSDLYVWGRRQDAAFEQPVGDSPKQRHHVRFWRSRELDRRGRPLWLGAATFDERVEISRTTGGVTHKIGPDIDSERNKLVGDAITARALDGYYWVEQFHPQRDGRNGGGDPYFTDRRLAVGVIDLRR
jgi:hypothetical protein